MPGQYLSKDPRNGDWFVSNAALTLALKVYELKQSIESFETIKNYKEKCQSCRINKYWNKIPFCDARLEQIMIKKRSFDVKNILVSYAGL